jgi:hypothetical protein
MKKLIVIAAATLVTISGYSQGTVQSANGATSLLTNSLTGASAIAGTTFRVALYYLPDQASAPTSSDFNERGILLGPGVNMGPVAGRYSTGTRSTPATTQPGGGAWFQVRAWEASYGADYMTAANAPAVGGRGALLGTSSIVRVDTGNPTTTPPGNPTAIAVPGFVLMPVPEPSVIALGVLGIGALLMLRRRS